MVDLVHSEWTTSFVTLLLHYMVAKMLLSQKRGIDCSRTGTLAIIELMYATGNQGMYSVV